MDPVFAADQLKRQSSINAFTVRPRTGTGRNQSDSRELGLVANSVISLPTGDLASVEEMTGSIIPASVEKRKRADTDDFSESEGEEYIDNVPSYDEGDEDYKQNMRRKHKTNAKRKYHPVDNVDDKAEEMDVFDEYEARKALEEKQEEMLKIRQYGSAAVNVVDSGTTSPGGSDINNTSGAESLLQQQHQRMERRRRTRDAVWAAFGLKRRRRRSRGGSCRDDESDMMSECSDMTSTSAIVTTPMQISTDLKSSEALMTVNPDDSVCEVVTGPNNDHVVDTTCEPNLKLRKLPHSKTKYRGKNIERSKTLNKYFYLPGEDFPDLEGQETYQNFNAIVQHQSEAVAALCPNSNSDSTSGRHEQSDSADGKTSGRVIEGCHVAATSNNLAATVRATFWSKNSTDHHICIPRFMTVLPCNSNNKTSHCTPSFYSILLPKDEGSKLGTSENHVLANEKIMLFNYRLQSGSTLAQILVPVSLLERDNHISDKNCVKSSATSTSVLETSPPLAESISVSNDPFDFKSTSSPTALTQSSADQCQQSVKPNESCANLTISIDHENGLASSPRRRSFSNASPTPSFRRRSGTLSFPPSSRERERNLRKNLQQVEEVLKYVKSVQDRRRNDWATAHPLQYAFVPRPSEESLSCSVLGNDVPYVSFMPFITKSKKNVGGIIAGYFNNSIQLMLASANNSCTRSLCNLMSSKGGVHELISSSCAGLPPIMRDMYHECRSNGLPNTFNEKRLRVQPLGSSSVRGLYYSNVYSLDVNLPSGVAAGSRMVAASDGVLVSQHVEKVHTTVSGDSYSQVAEFMQIWVLVDENEALTMDLEIRKSH